MPTVPKLNELEIGARGLPGVTFTPVEAQTHNISRLPDLNQQARTRGFGSGAHLGTGGVRKAELNDTDAAYQAAKQAGALQQQIGQGMSNLGLAIQDIAQKERDRADRVRVEWAQNALDELYLDEANNQDSGWKHRHGDNALQPKDGNGNLEQIYAERAKAGRDRIMEQLGNDRQREAFAEYAEKKRLQQKSDIQSHLNREFDDYEKANDTAALNNAANLIATGNDKEREEGRVKLEAVLARIQEKSGMGAEWLENARREAASGAMTSVINQAIDSGDLEGATLMRERYQGYLGADDAVKTAGSLKAAYEQRDVRTQVEDALSAGTQTFTPSQAGDAYAAYNRGYNRERVKQKLFGAESGNNNYAKNKRSSAYGRAQFIDGTWLEFGESAIGRQLRGDLSKAAWLEKRSDPRIAEAATDWYLQKNEKELRQAGVPWNDTTAYLAHFRGSGGAIAMYKADPREDARAHVLRVHGKTKGGEILAANPEVFAKGKTVGDVIAWAARKMNVKPDASLPTGVPEERGYLSDAQLKQEAYHRFPDDASRRAQFIDLYRSERDVTQEQQEQERAANLTAATEILWGGGTLADIPPTLRETLDSDDLIKLRKMASETEGFNERERERVGWPAYIEASNPLWLEKKSREQVLAYAVDKELSRSDAEKLLTKWESVAKAKQEGRGAKEQWKVDDNLKKAVIKTAFGDLLDPYNETKLNREQLSQVQYILQQRINDYGQAVLSGQIKEAEAIQLIINDLKETFIQPAEDVSFWSGGGWYRLGIDRKAELRPNVSIIPTEE